MASKALRVYFPKRPTRLKLLSGVEDIQGRVFSRLGSTAAAGEESTLHFA